MSASLVRKALDETTLASEEKLDHLSKKSSKRFKPQKKSTKISKDKLLKQNLKILKTLEQKVRTKSLKETREPAAEEVTKNLKKSNSKKKKRNPPQSESVFTEEDFEKFEKEYFVTS